MKTYASQIIFSIKCNGAFTGQYDEQWRLIYADSEQQAIEATKAIASQEATNFTDRHGRAISWELTAIKDVKELALGHGSLLNSSIVDVTPIASPIWENKAS